ncbi:TetR/AcrR family transcriptional regulator [Mycolicibacterium brisbanense]|uniref:Transcriptional regulator n=1 Tax=Mycolicibacterium brisbanense TaxID=146020 RepID=A0A100VZL6_9MYCO|nr:TetR/AcrR family transcriptional regulator [Mycolicibacterium brisbanense]MCV7158987.1 TetR/AcrR family transcriptional regulator [Mycolicibacterium brisbanense]GAS88841.1 transcriptional regulator [Mycolicibacterium brisbanense]
MTQARTPLPTRSALKRQTILAAGRELFLGNGFQGTSVDQIAARAEVSKQTVYKHFGDKRELLFAIVDDALVRVVGQFRERIEALQTASDLEPVLIDLAEEYLKTVLQEPVVQLRRLVIGEANRLPELAQRYYDRAPTQTLAALAAVFARLDARGLLSVADAAVAADHFAFLIVGRPIDEALFHGGPDVLARLDVPRYVRAGVAVFLAGYRRQ